MEKKNILDIEVTGKTVLVRADFNVPLDKNGKIVDITRIAATIPTIQNLIHRKAKVVLMSHLGRPKGKPNPQYSLAPVAVKLSDMLGQTVQLANDCVEPGDVEMAKSLKPGQVMLLENLRFHPEEEKNDREFAGKLAEMADVYVNDAFGVSHRAHASVAAITDFLPSVAGFLMNKEIQFIGKAVTNPKHPFVAIIGGAKVSDKIGVLENLIDKVDTLIIGGGMANTFLKAQGYDMGLSLVEEDKLELAQNILAKAQKHRVQFLLPVDVVVADKIDVDAYSKIVTVDRIPADRMVLDIGPETAAQYAGPLNKAEMVVWNGPMGVFEIDQFAKGTEAVAKAVASSKAVSIIGGGDSIAAIEKVGLAHQITHVSTGGGASLEFLEGRDLPGIMALENK